MATVLDAATRGLVRVALGLQDATEAQLGEWMRAATADGVPALWLEELLISSVLYVGYPRALVAMSVFRRLQREHVAEAGAAEGGGEVETYARWPEWQSRGEATCRVVYGKHYERLRAYVRELHPALDLWMLMDGYGKTLSRPGLDLMRRELCAVGTILPQRAPRQLVAHLRGALNAGATPSELDAVLDLAAEVPLPAEALAVARELWQELRDTLLHD